MLYGGAQDTLTVNVSEAQDDIFSSPDFLLDQFLCHCKYKKSTYTLYLVKCVSYKKTDSQLIQQNT